MLHKTTSRLFYGKYQYKTVLVCSGAMYFKGQDADQVFQRLSTLNLAENAKLRWGHRSSPIKSQAELDYTLQLLAIMQTMKDYDMRVESPWLTVYSNNRGDIYQLIDVDPENVKYVSEPATTLVENTVIMPKVNFEYKVTLGKTTQEYSAFVTWAETNKKLKLTKSCIRDLSKSNSWGGTYFYISGENNLLMAKMQLGGSINKIERIVKA